MLYIIFSEKVQILEQDLKYFDYTTSPTKWTIIQNSAPKSIELDN